MQISILTIFEELYTPFIKTSLIGRAIEKKIVQCDPVSLFKFVKPKERVDSPSFGPGAGMLFKPEVIQKAIDSQEQTHGKAFKVFFSPQGKKLDQCLLKSIHDKITANNNHLLLVASRYEGMDRRVEDYYADEIISVGDFVLMGGDLPAMCLIESLLRLVPGVVGKFESVQKESFSGPFVDYPEYTAPVLWNEMEVPEVVRSGNHSLIDKWREEKAVQLTVKRHFDWIRSYNLNKDQKNLAMSLMPSHYVVLMHSDVLLKDGKVGTTSVTSLDIHDIARSCTTFGIKNYFISTPLIDQQKIVQTLLDFWTTGFGLEYNASRAKAVKKVVLLNDFNEVINDIVVKENKKPIIIATSAKFDSKYKEKYITFHDQTKVWSTSNPILIVFGTGHGLAPHILEQCDYILNPIEGFSNFNHLSVRSAAAIVLDKWLGINAKKC